MKGLRSLLILFGLSAGFVVGEVGEFFNPIDGTVRQLTILSIMVGVIVCSRKWRLWWHRSELVRVLAIGVLFAACAIVWYVYRNA